MSASNYIVMTVGECKPKTWEYQEQENDRNTDYVQLYRVKGMPIMSKETDTILSINELVGLSQEGKEIEVIIDSPVETGTIILLQEVLSHGKMNVGTYRDATPEKNELGEAKYTGVVMGYDKEGIVQVYTLMGDIDIPQIWHVHEDLVLQDTEAVEPQTQQESTDGKTQVKLGGAIRFIARDEDFIGGDMGEGIRHITKIDVINKYV